MQRIGVLRFQPLLIQRGLCTATVGDEDFVTRARFAEALWLPASHTPGQL